jgi:Flp pilus assembly pilin Flp
MVPRLFFLYQFRQISNKILAFFLFSPILCSYFRKEDSMNFIREENGQTILEYALIIAVLVLVIIAAIPSLRGSVVNVFTGAQNKLVVPAN